MLRRADARSLAARPADDRGPGSMPRSAALIALAALAVHQLRYQLTFGSQAHEELAGQGHAYLAHALPVVIGFAVATLAAGLLRALLSGRPGHAFVAAARMRALLYALAIVAVFTIQETAEGLLSAGHPSGVEAAFTAGGWLALPLAALMGVLCAALDGGLATLEARVAISPRRLPRPRAPRRHGHPLDHRAVSLATLALAFGLARRPPPQTA